jgi:hypothetical protein
MGLGSAVGTAGTILAACHGVHIPFVTTVLGYTPTHVVAGASASLTACWTGFVGLRVKQTGKRLHKKMAALNPAPPTTSNVKCTIAEVIKLRGLTPSEHGPMVYWQHLPEAPPVLVQIEKYEIGPELSNTRLVLMPVRCAPGLSLPATSKNESFSPAPFLSEHGEVPSTFCIWTPRKPGCTPIGSAKFPDDYALFMPGERIQAKTVSGSIALACYHSINELALNYDPAECYITIVGASGINSEPVPYTFVSNSGKFPTKYTWLVEPDPKVLARLQPGCTLPAAHDHLQDFVLFEWDFDWSRLPNVRNLKFKPDPNVASDYTMLSVNNDAKIYKFDRHVRVLDEPQVVALTGATLSTAETGAGGSSGKAWRRVGDEWFCGGMHHGGIPTLPGFRNRMTPPHVLAQGIRKYCNEAWMPHYSQPFEEKFNPLAAHISSLISDEEKYQVDLGDRVPTEIASLPIFGELTSVCEGVLSPSQWNHMIKKIVKKTKSYSLARTLLYNSISKRVAEYDPEAAADAKEWLALEHESWLELRSDWEPSDAYMMAECSTIIRDYIAVLTPLGPNSKTMQDCCAFDFIANRVANNIMEAVAPLSQPTNMFVNKTPSWEQLTQRPAGRVSRDASPEEKTVVKTTAESLPPIIEEEQGVNHAVCIGGSKNESVVHEVAFAPITIETDYALQKVREGLDGTYPGNQRCYSIPATNALLHHKAPPQRLADPQSGAVAGDKFPYARRWIASSDSTPFPHRHLPAFRDYEERIDNSTLMNPASAESIKHFEFYLKTLLDHNHGDYMSMKLEDFGQLLSMVAGTLDGSLAHTEHFKRILGNQVAYEHRDHNSQEKTPVEPKVARFIGLTPYSVGGKTKDWHYQPTKTGWFDKWADVCWDDDKNRPAGACAAKGPEYVRKSINAQFERKLPRTTNYSIDHLKEYSRGLPAPAWDGDLTLEDYFRRILKGVSPDKGTAWNRVTGEATKGEWISNRLTGQNNLLSVIYRILILAATNHDVLLSTTPRGLFEAGLVVPEELFAKDEIHLNKKVDTDRLRVIWNTGVSAELVMRFFHDAQNKLEIELYQNGFTHSEAFPNFGSCSGMGHHDDGIAELCNAMDNLLKDEHGNRVHNGVSTDASGWDISVTRALWMTDAHRRAHGACSGHFPYGWCYAILNLGVVSSAHVIVIGKEMFEVRWYGMMPSGCASTTASNSHMRGVVQSEPHWRETGRIGKSLSMGDDNHARDKTSPAMKEVWRQLGVKIDEEGDTIPADQPIPFTSHLYDPNTKTATFNNGPKILLRLAYHGHQKLTREQATGIRFAVRHTPELRERIYDFISSAGGGRGKDWLDIDVNDPYVVMDFATIF